MIPANGACGISIVDPEGIAKAQVVPAKVTGEVYPVLLIDLIVGLYIQVIEIKAVISDRGVAREAEEEVGIGSPCADGKRTFILYNRAFGIEPGRDQPDTPAQVIVLVIPVIHFNIHYGGETTSIFGRHSPLVNRDILYSVRVEGGKESQEVRGIVDGGFIQQDQVLVGAPAPYKKTAVAVSGKLNAREQLDGLQDVFFPKEDGDILNLVGRQFLYPHQGFGDVVISFSGADHHFCQLGVAGAEFDG